MHVGETFKEIEKLAKKYLTSNRTLPISKRIFIKFSIPGKNLAN